MIIMPLLIQLKAIGFTKVIKFIIFLPFLIFLEFLKNIPDIYFLIFIFIQPSISLQFMLVHHICEQKGFMSFN